MYMVLCMIFCTIHINLLLSRYDRTQRNFLRLKTRKNVAFRDITTKIKEVGVSFNFM